VDRGGAPINYNRKYNPPPPVQRVESDQFASDGADDRQSKHSKSAHRSKNGTRVLVEKDYADMGTGADKSPSLDRARQKSVGSRSGSGGKRRRPKTKQSNIKGSRGTPLYYQSPGGEFDVDNFTAHISARRSSQKLNS